MKRVYIAGGAIAVLAWLALGLVIARGPQPEIKLPAEVLTSFGFFNITNTLLTAWVVMALLIGGSLIATRSMKLMPGGFQNFVEAVVGFLVDQVEDIAGKENGRRFFMVIATFFLFILTSNWFGLLPFFNAVGQTEDVGHHIFEQIQKHEEQAKTWDKREKFGAWKMDESGSFVVVKPNGKAIDFTIEAKDSPGQALDRYVVFLAQKFADYKRPAAAKEGELPSSEEVLAAKKLLDGNPTAPKLLAEGGEAAGVPSAALGASLTVRGVDFPGQKMALVVPWFRGVYSDVNNTLALGLCSFLIVEFWGFQALGFGYLKKFFNLKGINSFVGILELLSEFIRIISFTFRLFGNIFAGEVLVLMLTFLMPFLFVDIIYGLELFVGFIQAVVFALLTLVFATMAIEHHGEEEHKEGHHAEDGPADAHTQSGAAQVH